MSSAHEALISTALNLRQSGLGDCRIFSKSQMVRGRVLSQNIMGERERTDFIKKREKGIKSETPEGGDMTLKASALELNLSFCVLNQAILPLGMLRRL